MLSPRLNWLSERVAAYVVGALAVAGFVAAGRFVATHAWSLYDDAYIYLRYAENVLGGHGFRWNVDDAPVEGFTGPAYLLVLVAAGAAGADLETFVQLFGVLVVGGAIALGTVLAYALGRRADAGVRSGSTPPATSLPTSPSPPGDPATLFAALTAAVLTWAALATDHFFVLNAVIGLETGLAALLGVALLASVTWWDCRGLRTLLVLAVLTRPEAALFGLTVLVLPRARSVRWLAPLVGAAAVIALVRWVVFHDLVPNTFHAKAGGTPAHARIGAEYLLGVARHFPAIVLAPLALRDRRIRGAAGWFLLASAIWLASFLRTGGDFFPFSRLAVPLVGGLTVLGAHGLVTAARAVGQGAFTRTVAAVAVVLVLAPAGVAAQAISHRLAPMHGFPDVRFWTLLGGWLHENHPTATVATTTIGAIGYFSGLHVYDLVGLTQPEVARDGELIPAELTRTTYIGHEKHNTSWIIAQRPDLIVFERDATEPWTDVQATRATYYAEWALLQEIKAGRLPYLLYSPRLDDGRYALIFVSPEYVARTRAGATPPGPGP